MTFEDGPQVIVTDRDLTLMNVIGIVFPECYHLLCHSIFRKICMQSAKC